MEIQIFKWEDIGEIIKIERESFEKDIWDKEEFMKFFETCKDSFLVAKENEKIIGYIILEMIEPKKGYIRSIAVKKEKRKKGVARNLIEYIIKKFEIKELSLHVRAGNNAINFYKKLGFKEIERLNGVYHDGEDAIYMVWKIKCD
ncbi:MAG: ribosomal protein S18-alanine N-acetyltransferase [Candidatus Micrarchaeia archaeon]